LELALQRRYLRFGIIECLLHQPRALDQKIRSVRLLRNGASD
jgi:hypothetical protein